MQEELDAEVQEEEVQEEQEAKRPRFGDNARGSTPSPACPPAPPGGQAMEAEAAPKSRSPRRAGGLSPSGASNVGDLAAVLRQVLREEKLAKQESVDKFGAAIEAHDERLSALEESNQELRATLADLRTEIAELRQERTAPQPAVVAQAGAPCPASAAPPGVPSAASGLPAGGAAWEPRFVHVRGFAPYGCPPAQKLTKEQYGVEGRRLLDALPAALRAQVRLQPPYVLSHQISFLVPVGGLPACRVLADALESVISAQQLKIKGQDIRAGIETSPQRRTLCQNMFGALDRVRARGREDRVEVCGRSLKLHVRPDFQLLGHTPPGSTTWSWDPAGLAAIGLTAADLDADAMQE